MSAVLLLYWTTVRHDFVNYDDGDYVTGNQHVQEGITWQGLLWAFTTGHASNWHPLTWISHMLDCQLFGLNPGLHHLVSVGFHMANTPLLFLVLRRITGQHWRSAFVAAIFGLHPLHVESVAWVSERKDVLSTFFLFLTLGAYVLYAEQKRGALQPAAKIAVSRTAKGKKRQEPGIQISSPSWANSALGPAWSFYVAALALFSFGLMSKPMLVTVPFLLLLLDYWPLQRIGLPTPNWNASFAGWRVLILEKVPFFALAVLSSIITFLVQREGGAVSKALTIGQRLGNSVVSYVRYLYKAIWPNDLSVLYPHPAVLHPLPWTWPAWLVALALVILGAITAFVSVQLRRRPYLAVGWFWFIGMLVPVIGIVQVGIQSMADRYTYVPLVGLTVAVAWGIAEAFSRGERPGPGMITCSALALLGCSLLAARQIGFWHDSDTLFSHAVEVHPDNYLAWNNLGFYRSNHGRPAEGMSCYQRSLEINPNYEDALNNMGFVLAGMKRHTEAIPYYERALRLKPHHVEVNNNLGNALSELGRIPEAMEHYQIALSQKPDHADAHNNLGIALAMQGRLTEAMPHFRDAIRYKKDYASAHSNLGNALAAEQKWDEAIAEYEQCLRLNPKDPQAHNNLANVLTSKGKLAEAIGHYETALTLNSNNPEAHFNLGMVLLQLGKQAEARAHFAEAVRLKPDYAQAQRQLGAGN